MNKKIVIIPILIIAVFVLISFSSDENVEKKVAVFHVTLADPKLYDDGAYTDTISIKEGEYSFRFVPNGNSPKILSVTLSGESFDFHEDFKRVGTQHQTGISEYYTWDYDGEKNIVITEMQEISIVIDPNGETLSSVSVDILEN